MINAMLIYLSNYYYHIVTKFILMQILNINIYIKNASNKLQQTTF